MLGCLQVTLDNMRPFMSPLFNLFQFLNGSITLSTDQNLLILKFEVLIHFSGLGLIDN